MMKNFSLFSSSVCVLAAGMLFASCEKKELPVPAHDPGDVITATVNMDQDYKWQLYYNLETNTVVGKNVKTAWDLGFETSAEGYHIVLNAAKMMFAYNTGKTDINAVSFSDTVGIAQKLDAPSGNMDSTAIGNWQDKGMVYIIDMGVGPDGSLQGYRKVIFERVDAQGYKIRFAAMDGSDLVTLEVKKDEAYNFSFVSFTDKKQLTIEPPKDTWHIAFTQYTHMFTDPPIPYMVTGCLLNRSNIEAAIDSVTAFADISYEMISAYEFSPAINIIGYDWKAYTGSTYVTNAKITYIIKSRDGIYYKLHFIDFLNAGVKGNPRWEYQKL